MLSESYPTVFNFGVFKSGYDLEFSAWLLFNMRRLASISSKATTSWLRCSFLEASLIDGLKLGCTTFTGDLVHFALTSVT